MFIYFWERETKTETETETEQGRGRERERQNLKQAPGSELAVSTEPDEGLEPTNHEIVTWAEVRRLTAWATQAPQHFQYLKQIHIAKNESCMIIAWGANCPDWNTCSYYMIMVEKFGQVGQES